MINTEDKNQKVTSQKAGPKAGTSAAPKTEHKSHQKSNVKHTSDGEMPDADSVSKHAQSQGDVRAAFNPDMQSGMQTGSQSLEHSGRVEERIPESQGDLADRAEEEIENEIKGRIDRIREESKFPSRDRH